MDLNKIIIICVVYAIFGVDSVFSSPTFANDHVHIKVHLAPKHSTIKHIANLQHQHVNHKIIHHYHGYERPFEKLRTKEIVPVLENFYLSELDKHQQAQKPKFVEETFLVETHSSSPKPKDEAASTIGILQQPHHKEYAKNPVETIRLIASDETHYNSDNKLQHQNSVDDHIATVKVVEGNSFDRYQQEKHLEEVIKIIQGPTFVTPTKHLDYQPQVKEVVDEDPVIASSLSQTAKNHNYDIQYDYVSPETTQSFRFQEVPIYPEIPYPQRSGDASTVIIENHIKYKPTEGDFKYLQQEIQNMRHTSITSTDEEQGTLKYVADYQKYLPSSETSQSFNNHQGSIHSNTNDQANPNAVETYTGYDSYSAAHVQGLGSGGYSKHKPL